MLGINASVQFVWAKWHSSDAISVALKIFVRFNVDEMQGISVVAKFYWKALNFMFVCNRELKCVCHLL